MDELEEEPEPVFTFEACVMLFKLSMFAVVAVGMGVMMLFSPNFRENPRQLAANELCLGLIMILFGLFWVLIAVWIVNRRRWLVQRYEASRRALSEQDDDDPARH